MFPIAKNVRGGGLLPPLEPDPGPPTYTLGANQAQILPIRSF